MKNNMRQTYILQCSDWSLYTGVTTDLARRLSEHNSDPKWAKYTTAKRPVRLVRSQPAETRSEACKREWEIKQMNRDEKLYLISQNKF